MDVVEPPIRALQPIETAEALERMLAPPMAGPQPPLLELPPAELHAAISSLVLGGAERIVMAWATRGAALHRVSIVVLRDATNEWIPPVGVEVVRLHGRDVLSKLEEEGRRMAASGTVMLCHLLTAAVPNPCRCCTTPATGGWSRRGL